MKFHCSVRRRIAILIRYTQKTPLVQNGRSNKDYISVNFYLLILWNRSPFWLYKNMWSSTCLEAQENVLLLILLPVSDTGLFIALLYLPIHCRLVICQHGSSLRCFWKPPPKRIFYREPTRNSINNWPFWSFGTTWWI